MFHRKLRSIVDSGGEWSQFLLLSFDLRSKIVFDGLAFSGPSFFDNCVCIKVWTSHLVSFRRPTGLIFCKKSFENLGCLDLEFLSADAGAVWLGKNINKIDKVKNFRFLKKSCNFNDLVSTGSNELNELNLNLTDACDRNVFNGFNVQNAWCEFNVLEQKRGNPDKSLVSSVIYQVSTGSNNLKPSGPSDLNVLKVLSCRSTVGKNERGNPEKPLMSSIVFLVTSKTANSLAVNATNGPTVAFDNVSGKKGATLKTLSLMESQLRMRGQTPIKMLQSLPTSPSSFVQTSIKLNLIYVSKIQMRTRGLTPTRNPKERKVTVVKKDR